VLHPLPAPAWDTGPEQCKHDECSGGALDIKGLKWGGNTHLWVVNRALELLAKSNDPTAKNVVARMNTKACRAQWEAGLWDVDHGFLAEDFGTGQTDANTQRLGSHFYNGAGRDAFGEPTKLTTYSLLGEKVRFGDARLNARYRLPGMLRRPGDMLPDSNGNLNGVDIRPAPGHSRDLTDRELLEMAFTPYYRGSFVQDTTAGDERCLDLGLALHYLTDNTQPMHASSFDAFQDPKSHGYPLMLHAVFEEYVPTIQTMFPVTSDMRWEAESAMVKNPKTADEVFDEAAKAANAEAPALMQVLIESPGGCWYNPDTFIDYDRRASPRDNGCFRDPSRKAAVEAAVGKVLLTAYQSTASYLWAAFREEYQTTELGERCPIGTEWGNDRRCYQACSVGYKPTEPVSTYCAEACPKEGCKAASGEPRDPKVQKRESAPAKIVTR
jgi:hypothetical protein